MKNANMELWDSVCLTDPAQTKRVNQRGGFTAIGAQYQIREATKVWGPYGKAWGVRNCGYTEIRNGEVLEEIALLADFFYPGGEFEIATDIAYKPGNDTRKKLLTDLTTKALSKLGFNADVFMGLFDDNKYVNEARRRHTTAEQPPEGTTTADKLPPKSPKGDGEKPKTPATVENSVVWLTFVYEGLSKDGDLDGNMVDNVNLLRRRMRDGWPGNSDHSDDDKKLLTDRANEVIEMYDKRTAPAATE